MAQAGSVHTTPRRRPEDAATIGLMMLKASISGLDNGPAPVKPAPKSPVLVGGAVLEMA